MNKELCKKIAELRCHLEQLPRSDMRRAVLAMAMDIYEELTAATATKEEPTETHLPSDKIDISIKLPHNPQHITVECRFELPEQTGLTGR